MKQLWIDKITRVRPMILPAGVVVLGIVAVAVGQSAPNSTKLTAAGTSTDQTGAVATESPAPTVSPTLTVDGKPVPMDSDGSTEVSTSDGKTTVSASSGHTVITTTQEPKSGDTSNQKSGNVNVNVNSNSNGGTSFGTVQTFGMNNTNNNFSTNVSSTSVFSTGGDNVSISQ